MREFARFGAVLVILGAPWLPVSSALSESTASTTDLSADASSDAPISTDAEGEAILPPVVSVIEEAKLHSPQETDLGLAPLVNEDYLGKPYSSDFIAMGKSLFSNAKIQTFSINKMTSEMLVIETSASLSLNAGAWGLGSISASGNINTRYAAFRIYYITDVVEIDEGDEKPAEAPPEAYYYLKRIFMGHLYEMRFAGTEADFTSSAKSNFKIAKGGIDAFASLYNLDVSATTIGIKPKTGEAFFASPDKIADNYTIEDVPSAPIFAQYRVIPGRTPPLPQVYEFNNQKCPVTKMSTYSLTILGATIQGYDANGAIWDTLGGSAPDPKAYVYLNDCDNGQLLIKTNKESNNYEPLWDRTAEVELGPDDFLCIKLEDYDPFGSNDLIGQCNTKPFKKWKGSILSYKDCGEAKTVTLSVAATEDESAEEDLSDKTTQSSPLDCATIKQIQRDYLNCMQDMECSGDNCDANLSLITATLGKLGYKDLEKSYNDNDGCMDTMPEAGDALAEIFEKEIKEKCK